MNSDLEKSHGCCEYLKVKSFTLFESINPVTQFSMFELIDSTSPIAITFLDLETILQLFVQL